jgi:hypothetical protein
MSTLKELIGRLIPELQEEVQDFVEFLLEKRARKAKRKPELNWAGALKDLSERYGSVELQHKIAGLISLNDRREAEASLSPPAAPCGLSRATTGRCPLS